MSDGPLREFAEQLRQLRVAAGSPTYRELSRKAQYSTSALAAATNGQSLPSQEVTLAFVRACGGDEQEWRERWMRTSELLHTESVVPRTAGTDAVGDPQPAVPSTTDAPHDPAPRNLIKIGLAPLIVILAIVVVAALNQHGHSPARLTSQPPATSALLPPNTQESPPADAQNDGTPANQPPATTATTSAAQAYRYDKTTGVGCADTPGTSVFQDQPDHPTHLWASAAAASWSVQDCPNALVATTPTTNANPDHWQNDYGWNFTGIPTTAACTFHIYIADSQDSQYHADYYWTTGAPDYVDANDFQLDQAALRGTWAVRGPFAFPTGAAMLEMTDARTTGPDAPMTASVVRLTCN